MLCSSSILRVYTILPNGEKETRREFSYNAPENKTYDFKIYAGGKYITKSITVNNIYKEIVASCTLTEGSNQIFASVNVQGGYGELEYIQNY